MSELLLLLGGARSGKSALAVQIANASENSVIFIATAEALDDDIYSLPATLDIKIN